MNRLPVFAAILLLPGLATAQEVPASAEQDLWCGTAFLIMTRDAPADAASEAAWKVYAEGGERLIQRALPVFLEAGYDEAALAAHRAQLEDELTRFINVAPDPEGPRYSFQVCNALIGQ